MQTLGLLFKILSFALLFSVLWSRGLLAVVIIYTIAFILYFIGACIEDMPSRAERQRIKEDIALNGLPRSDEGFKILMRTKPGTSFTILINLFAVTMLYVFIFNEDYALIELVVVPLVLLSGYLIWSEQKKYKKALKEFDEIDDTDFTE